MGLGESCASKVLRATLRGDRTDHLLYVGRKRGPRLAFAPGRNGPRRRRHNPHRISPEALFGPKSRRLRILLRLGSEREVKAAGLQRVEGKEYVMRDGDEIVVRFSV